MNRPSRSHVTRPHSPRHLRGMEALVWLSPARVTTSPALSGPSRRAASTRRREGSPRPRNSLAVKASDDLAQVEDISASNDTIDYRVRAREEKSLGTAGTRWSA